MSTAAARRVVLVHGLWMPGVGLWRLASRLRRAGCTTRTFDYPSISGGPEATIERLAALLAERDCDVIAHSLGGLVTLSTLAAHPQLPVRRVVCLGSPRKGSAAARAFAAWGRGGEVLLGHNRDLLEQGFERWDGPREVGVIAGRLPLGLGAMLGQLEGEHDGTVAVEETRLPGVADHCVVEANHTGLLFSQEVAQRVDAFLRHGRFGPAAS